MSRVIINHVESERFVTEQQAKGVDVSWDGWTMVFWKPNHNGWNDRHGAFKNGKWGVQARVNLDEDGQWRIPVKYIASRRKGT